MYIYDDEEDNWFKNVFLNNNNKSESLPLTFVICNMCLWLAVGQLYMFIIFVYIYNVRFYCGSYNFMTRSDCIYLRTVQHIFHMGIAGSYFFFSFCKILM